MRAKPMGSTPTNKNAYIPPAVQKSIAQHMERSMPAHLKKYQQSGGIVPQHAEKAMADYMQKNLPAHLKQYVNPYLHQNVVYAGAGSFSPPSHPAPTPSGTPKTNNGQVFNQSFFNPNPQQTVSPAPNTAAPVSSTNSVSSNPYDFIMQPEQPKKTILFPAPSSMKMRILLLVGVLVTLIMLAVIFNSFLSSANNAQTDRLLQLARSQTEIIRVIDEASDKVTDSELLTLSTNTKISVASSKNEVLSALSKRGKKVKDKDLGTSATAQNDAALTEGEQNNRFDETYQQLLEQQLRSYSKLLEDVYNSGNKSEKEITVNANNQINLLIGKDNKANQQ